jgi:hypothetical protein
MVHGCPIISIEFIHKTMISAELLLDLYPPMSRLRLLRVEYLPQFPSMFSIHRS